MSNINSAIEELATILFATELPRSFLDGYDPLECLSHGHGTETYLVQQKGSNRLCIAKCYDKEIYKSVNESSILKTLSHEGLPAFMAEYQNDTLICIVREYIEGTPLDKYIAERHLTEAQIVGLCVKLCDILIYLHGLEPPVIHRDIKPQNIIVKEDGEISLIDFDIARTYDKEAEIDTQFMGTRTYAPPEQYGFAQTDCRADIYSLGILLCLLLTGNTDTKKAKITNKRLSFIMNRCASFSPQERFSNVADVKKALLISDGQKQKRRTHLFRTASLVLLALSVGFTVGRYTDFLAPTVTGVTFAEPLIEQAVRVQLGKNETETITSKNLLAVREIYIFGNEVAKTEEVFSDGLSGQRRDTPRGELTTLADVKLLPNLEVLYVNYQTLTDISPVSKLKYLTTVSLRSTFVEDISALSGMKQLNSVCLFDTHVSDLSPLGSCPALCLLDIGMTPITSLSALPDIASLRSLSLRRTQLPSLEGIDRFKLLEKMDLYQSLLSDLTPLLSLPNLYEISIDETMRGTAETLENPSFTIKYE